MHNRNFAPGMVAILLAASLGHAAAAGNPQKGAQIFIQCKACHSLEAGKNLVGPSLHGLFGRKAGTAAGYNYSPAMKSANVTWNDDTLTKYLTDPKAFVPGDKMPFIGVKDPAKLADLIAYLKQATQ